MRLLIACIVAAIFVTGCNPSAKLAASNADAPAAPATQPATSQPACATTQAAVGGPAVGSADVMAYVDSKPIYMNELYDVLVEAYGMPVAQQLVATALVEHLAASQGITEVTPEQIQAESDRTLLELFPQVTNPAQREQLLSQMLQQRGMIPRQWTAVMHRNVLLRQMAAKNVTITEQDLRAEYEQEYGRQVQVRHIELATLQAAQDALKRAREGADFAQLAIELSTSPTAQEGGLIPPIGPRSPISPALRDAALAMTEVGQISEPVQSGTVFHIMKLEKVILPHSVPFEQVREQMQQRLMQDRLRGEQRRIIETLIDEAQQNNRIQFVNPVLAGQAKRAEQ